MKAFLLAAGTGSRMRPITDHIPKCMLPIGGTPLLDLWLDALHRAGVDEVLINLHHLPHIVLEHLQARKRPPAVHTAFEPELLGSAGTLRQHRSWVEDEEFFLALNADNLTDFDLRRLIEFHRSGDAVATLTVFPAEDPSRYGVVDIDQSGLVTGFSGSRQSRSAIWPTPACTPSVPVCFSRSTTRLLATSGISFSHDWLDGHAR